MPLEKTEAVILRTANWSESSRTVVVFSRDFGKITLVDKGGRRFSTKRGRLVPFARLEIAFYASGKSGQGYVSDTEVIELYTFEKDGTLGRLAYASAACELLNHLLSEQEPQEQLYRLFIAFLQLLDDIEKKGLSALFICFFLHLLTDLGYHLSLTRCVGCEKPTVADDSKIEEYQFSPERGGIVCNTCQTPGEYYLLLSKENTRRLVALQDASLTEAAGVSIGYTDAAYLLDVLTKFTISHTGLSGQLKSLEFLEKMKNGPVPSQ
jgi:DNA repair protein RecO (recombination protein O)